MIGKVEGARDSWGILEVYRGLGINSCKASLRRALNHVEPYRQKLQPHTKCESKLKSSGDSSHDRTWIENSMGLGAERTPKTPETTPPPPKSRA